MSDDGRTMEDMTWWGYVKSVAPHDTNATIAKKVGVSPPSVSRWQGKNSADTATAAAFARAYGRPVLEAFVAAGFLTADEAGEQPAAPPMLAMLRPRRSVDGGPWPHGTRGGPGGPSSAAHVVVGYLIGCLRLIRRNAKPAPAGL